MTRALDLQGKKFGKLIVIKKMGVNKNGLTMWLCKCDCGDKKVIQGSSLSRGLTKSCGCLIRENGKSLKTHGLSKTRLYSTWSGMKQRCLNPHNRKYKDYGGRGIKICDEWINDFINFYNWAQNNGYCDNLTIDRINVNGNYAPDNCRWATIKEQIDNRRNTKLITFSGETRTILEWSKELDISINTLKYRLKKRLSTEEILNRKSLRHRNIKRAHTQRNA